MTLQNYSKTINSSKQICSFEAPLPKGLIDSGGQRKYQKRLSSLAKTQDLITVNFQFQCSNAGGKIAAAAWQRQKDGVYISFIKSKSIKNNNLKDCCFFIG
jgi:hypothetical protein